MAPTKLHNIKLKHAIYMCNYGLSSVKPLSQKILAIYSLVYQPCLSRYYSMKVNAHKEASIKCEKAKSGIVGRKLSTRVFIPWFG